MEMASAASCFLRWLKALMTPHAGCRLTPVVLVVLVLVVLVLVVLVLGAAQQQ